MKTRVQLLLFVLVLLGVSGCARAGEDEPPGTDAEMSRQSQSMAMKSEDELQSVWVQLAEKVDEDPNLREEVAEVFECYLQTGAPSTEELVWRQLYRFLRDPNASPPVRSQALRLFVNVEAKKVLRQVVLTPVDQPGGRDLIGAASRALGGMKDEESLPLLIHVLSANNFIQIGSDTATAHVVMKSRLMGAIRAITGIDGQTDNRDISEITDPGQHSRALRAARDLREAERVISEAKAWATRRGIPLLGQEKMSSGDTIRN